MRHSLMRAIGPLAAAALAALPVAASAQQRVEAPLMVSYPTDSSMSCEHLVTEISRMEQIVGISAQSAQNAQNQGQMAEAAAGVAVNAALYSGALSRVPGLGLFANAAGAAARRNAEARAQAEAQRIQVAEQRRTLLTGIYQGRQCGVPVAAPTPAPVATTVVVAAPAAEGAVQSIDGAPQTDDTSGIEGPPQG